jgi:carboxymethylenebutenolidase
MMNIGNSGGEFVPRKTALSSGFAAAVRPVTAQTITTDDDGLIAGEVRIPTADGEIPGYRARPAKGTKFPIVLVVHEIFGVHEHIKDLCRRFAKVGYAAIAPELFARHGDVSTMSDFTEILSKVVSKTSDAQVLSDLDSAAKFSIESNSGDPDRVGIVGFCWGGRITWLYAAHSKALKAGGAFYGRLVGQNSELQPNFPVDVADKLKAPVKGFYGGQDQGIPLETVDTMKALLKAANSASEIVVFPNAGHAFFADYRPSYNAEAATAAWAELLQWYTGHGL